MKVIGLTGGIGTGKSTVSRMLSELGARVIDADKLGHEALLPDSVVWQEMVEAFGPGILKPDREIDRAKLGKIVFSSPEALKRINTITHPRLYRMVETRIEEYRRQGVQVVAVEAAALIEANWAPLMDEIWVTVASQECVVGRVKKRSKLSGEEILARIRSQISPEERVRHATVVIDTDCTLERVRERVEKELNRLAEK